MHLERSDDCNRYCTAGKNAQLIRIPTEYKTSKNRCFRKNLYSVISIPKRTLDPTLWDTRLTLPKLRPQARHFILSNLLDDLAEHGYKHAEDWMARVFLIGSLATTQYETHSELDVTIAVNTAKLVALDDKVSN